MYSTGSSAQSCVDIEGWDGGRVGARLKKEKLYVYLQLIYVVVQQKLTQYCKATVYLFLKICMI